ncbi:hypothetical protein PE067_11060 [Paracoccus sp. DMF-8]|uniref:hypothetical protein n=1 Tax=Paracoccus sp. DMF-8 TaxID=3019445 RepID=UPI0023E78C81|nr:hypothetical protein [Paracoccus sp. DMF-8]MDF3606633.1 hypothetical protein [Paracoccus sp. DMF-8]
MANPEVLVESINVLETRRASQEAQNDKLLVENNRDAIFRTATAGRRQSRGGAAGGGRGCL